MKKTASILSSVILIALMTVAPSLRHAASSTVIADGAPLPYPQGGGGHFDGAPLPYPQIEGGTLVADGAPLPYPQSGGGHHVV